MQSTCNFEKCALCSARLFIVSPIFRPAHRLAATPPNSNFDNSLTQVILKIFELDPKILKVKI